MKTAVKEIVMAYGEIDSVVGTEMRLKGTEILELKLTLQISKSSKDYVVKVWDNLKRIAQRYKFRVMSKTIGNSQYEILLVNMNLLDDALDILWDVSNIHQQNYWVIQGRKDAIGSLEDLQELHTKLVKIVYTTANMSKQGSPTVKEAIRTSSMYTAYQEYKREFNQLTKKMNELALCDESMMVKLEEYTGLYVVDED